jgi:hypothetical protein
MVPADILSGGCARGSSSDSKTQRIWAKEWGCGGEDWPWRASPLRMRSFLKNVKEKEKAIWVAFGGTSAVSH